MIAGKPPKAADRIRDTAKKLFYTKGIRAVGVDEIVAEAGVTKPSLYRSYGSKDALAADYLRTWGEDFMTRLEAAVADHPGDMRAALLTWIGRIAANANKVGYRGCALSNAAIEYPQADHPGRLEAEAHKRILRRRLVELAALIPAGEPQVLADSLLLIAEGCFMSGQIYGEAGPAVAAERTAAALIDAHAV